MADNHDNLDKLMLNFTKYTSFLSVHNLGSRVSEFYEIHVPYMITYETCNAQTKECIFLQLAPTGHIRTSFSSDEFPYVNQRSQHHHNFFEVMYILSGHVKQHVENKCYEYTTGQCCILNRNIHHCEEFTTDFEIVFFMMSNEFVTNLLDRDIQYFPDGTSHNYFGAIYHLIEENQRSKYYDVKEYIDFCPLHTLTPNDPILTEFQLLFNQMIDETIRQRPGCYFIMEGLVSRFFSMLEDSNIYHKNHIKLTSSSKEQLLVNVSHLMEFRHGRISREELEHILNYNGDYLNRIAKELTGMTLVEYGQIFCLKEAERCLLHTDKNITDIINELGFSNRSYFNRVFKKRYGMTPKEYRQMNHLR